MLVSIIPAHTKTPGKVKQASIKRDQYLNFNPNKEDIVTPLKYSVRNTWSCLSC